MNIRHEPEVLLGQLRQLMDDSHEVTMQVVRDRQRLGELLLEWMAAQGANEPDLHLRTMMELSRIIEREVPAEERV